MPVKLSSFFILIGLAMIEQGFCEEKTQIFMENQFLEAELGLAKTPSIYIIFNFKDKTIYLKGKGKVLKAWEMKRARFWGNPPPVKSLSLVKKSTLFPPKRKNIIPGNSEGKDNFELEILELKDMPSNYTLSMEGGIVIYIRPKGKGFIPFLSNLGHTLKWYLFPPLKTLWLHAKKKSYSSIDIQLSDKNEAKAFYWAFLDGLKAIIYHPSPG